MSADGNVQIFGGAPTPEELVGYDLNDFGNAMRLIRLCGGEIDDEGHIDTAKVRLLYQLGGDWTAFNGRYWDRETGSQLAWRMAQEVGVKMQQMRDDLVVMRGMADGVLQKFIDSCGSRSACANMLAMAIPHLTVHIEEFDSNPMLINCRNGTLVLEAGADGGVKKVLRRHEPRDRITRYIDLDYDEAAAAPLFNSTVKTALPEEDKRSFFQRALGYSCTGDTREQAFFMCQGLGNDGKSTILAAIRKAMGSYGGTADAKTFLDIGQQASANASPDLAKLAGDIRLIVLSEAKKDVLLNESLLKQWTGGDPVQARNLNAKFFEYLPIGKLWWQFNGWPKAQGNDDGIWRRLFPIVFENQIAAADVDRLLPKKMEAEQAGILNWVIDGVGDWITRGLDPPPCVLAARDRYRKTSSPFIDWLTTRCVYGKAAAGKATSSKELYDDFKAWATNQGHEKVMSATSFGRAMGERQIEGRKSNGNIYRSPIRFKTLAELAADNAAEPTLDVSAAPAAMSGEAIAPAADPFLGDDERW